MKYIAAVALLLASLVAASPAPAQASVNAAANNGEKGLDNVVLTEEAAALEAAGDTNLATTGAVFASVDAQFAKSTAAIAAQFAAATADANANAGKDNKAAAKDNKAAAKDDKAAAKDKKGN